jgi:hypothetical protein
MDHPSSRMPDDLCLVDLCIVWHVDGKVLQTDLEIG